MNKQFDEDIKEVLNNIKFIHKKAEMTMDKRKKKYNLEDNSKFTNIKVLEKELDIISKIPINKILDNDVEDGYLNDIQNIIMDRKTIRDYSNKKIKLKDFLNILKYTFGYRDFVPGIYGYKKFPVSYTPSAGGLSCVLHYIIVKNIENLEPGVYRYNRMTEELEFIFSGNYYYKMSAVFYETHFSQDSSFMIILYSDMERIVWKYGERGYRFAHLDAGVISQNLHLLSRKYNIGSCMIAGYQDDEIRRLLNLNNLEIPMLIMTFGYMKKNYEY